MLSRTFESSESFREGGGNSSIELLSDFDSAYMKEGYLQKKGQLLKGWKRRWYVCDGRTLSYYHSKAEMSNPNSSSMVLQLEFCTVQDGGISETWNSPRIYLTDGTTGTMYCLSAEDGDTVSQWLSVLRNAVARFNTKPSLSSSSSTVEKLMNHTTPLQKSPRKKSRLVTMATSASSVASEGTADTNNNNKRMATTIPLENQLMQATETLEQLFTLGPDPQFELMEVVHGHGNIRLQVHRPTGKYVKGSMVMAVPVELILFVLSDATKRKEWDPQFPQATIMASYSDTTKLIQLENPFGSSPPHDQHEQFAQELSSSSCFLLLNGLLSILRKQYKVVGIATVAALVLRKHDVIDLFQPFTQGLQVLQVVLGMIAGVLFKKSDLDKLAAMVDFAFLIVMATILLFGLYMIWQKLNKTRNLQLPRKLFLLQHFREQLDVNHPNLVLETSVRMDFLSQHNLPRDHQHSSLNLNEVGWVNSSGFLIEPVSYNAEEMMEFFDLDTHPGHTSPSTSAGKTMVTFLTDLDWLKNSNHPDNVKQKHVLAAKRVQFVLMGLCSYVEQFQYKLLQEIISSSSSSSVKDASSDSIAPTISSSSLPSQWHPKDYMVLMSRVSSGGLKLTDKEVVKKQKGVLMEVIKSAGATVLEGKSAVSLSLPVRIFEPRSMLDRIVDLWLYGPHYLEKAVAATDKVERFKYVMSFAFSGLHHALGQLKPFNPILGETLQTTFYQPLDTSKKKTKVYCEHTSHHPVISNFLIEGNGYKVWGYFVFGSGFKTNALTSSQKGPIYVQFTDDNSVIKYTMPWVRYGGFLWGDRITEIMGTMDFEDETNKLYCELRFNPDEKKSSLFSNSVKLPSDSVRGAIVNYAKGMKSDESTGVMVSGSWLDELVFDDVCYWSISGDQKYVAYTQPLDEQDPETLLLPSDVTNREDVNAMLKGDLDQAQEWKLKLEKKQRADRAKRLQGRRKNHWANAQDQNDH